jgi:hypothetical protein
MHSKNKARITTEERYHIARVKEMACAVCEAPGPSEAHEIEQGEWFLSVPLCASCHRDNLNGIHGAKVMWKVMKITEMSALNETLRRLIA